MNCILFILLHKTLTYSIALVWLINGLFCKVLNLVPRHRLIVSRILSEELATPLTYAIGLAEIAMAIWIISKYAAKINALLQIIIISIMNVIEFILVPDLLLWGKMNAIFAFLLVLVVYYNEFILGNKIRKVV